MNAVAFVHEQLDTKGKAKLPNLKAPKSVSKVLKEMLLNARDRVQQHHLQFVR